MGHEIYKSTINFLSNLSNCAKSAESLISCFTALHSRSNIHYR